MPLKRQAILLALLWCATAACEQTSNYATHQSGAMQADILYSISATIDNTAPPGTIVFLSCPPDDTQVIGNNRATFRTPHAPGERYRVTATASTPGVSCVVRNASGVMPAAPVDNVAVHCGLASMTVWPFDPGTQADYTYSGNVLFAGGAAASSVGHPGWIYSNAPVGLNFLYAFEAQPGPGGCLPYVTFNVSPDGVDWYTYLAGAWQPAPDDWHQGTMLTSPDPRPMNAWADKFGPGVLYVKMYLPADATHACAIDSFSVKTESVAAPASSAGIATRLEVTAFPASTVAGAAHALQVTAYDALGAIASAYTGTVRLSSTDGSAVLPANYNFTAGDAGVAAFSATLVTAGTQAIAASDITNPAIAGSQRNILVTAAAASSFAVHGFPSPQQANAPALVCLTAFDAYGNVADGFNDTMDLATSDPNAVMASSVTFAPSDAGNICLPVTFRTVGQQLILAYSATDTSFRGAQREITIVPGPATQNLGGTVSGLVAGQATLVNAVDNDVVSAGNGNFVFAQKLGYGQNYNVSALPPPGQSCTVSDGQAVMGGNDVFTIAVICGANDYSLGGGVAGLLSNTNVTLVNGNDTLVVANGNFTFPTPIAYNSNFAVSVASSFGQSCTFVNNSNAGVMPPSNDMNVRVSCTTNLYSLGGRISGLLANTNVILSDGNDTTPLTNGNYQFPTLLPYARVYSIAIANPNGQSCAFSPAAAGNGNMPAAPVTNANVVCTTNTYPLGGHVTGLVTGNITLTNTVNADAISVGNGNYIFDQNIAYAGDYNVAAASPAGLDCTVANGNAVMAVGGEYNVYISCTPKTYTLGGAVSGLVGGANVTLRNGNDIISVANGNFVYPTGVAYNSNFSASLLNPNGQTCSFTGNSNAGVMPAGNDSNIRVSCTPNLYALGGFISGLLSNANVILADGNDTISLANGAYTFPTLLPYARAYSIGITNPSGQICAFNPNSAGSGTISDSNVFNANIVCSASTYPLGGYVTGLVTGNITLTNTVNADAISVGNGNYIFDQNIAYAGNYNISAASPAGLNCTVANANAVMAVGGEYNVYVACVRIPYLLGGVVTGLLGNTNVTLLNGNDAIAVANGNFTFPGSVIYNSNFSASLVNPNGQTCVFIANSNVDIMPAANDTNVAVSCSTNSYSLGGLVTGLLANTNVTLSDGNDTISPSNGSYNFPTLIPYARSYAVTITNPNGQTCVFNPNTAGNGNMGTAPVTNANVACTTNSYVLGGRISGLLTNTNVTLSNGNDTILVTNGNFTFPTQVLYNSNFAAGLVNPNGQTCAFVANSNAGVMPPNTDTNIVVSCASNLYTLGGAISGLVANTNVAIQDGNDAISRTNGFYTFSTSLPSGRVYNIGITNPSGQACAFNPNTAGTGTIGSTNVTNANIVCTALPYTLGGTVSGLLTNTNVTLSNGNDTILVTNGNFTFPTQVLYNSNFAAGLVNPNGQTCTFVANSNAGVMPPNTDTNIVVSCASNIYTLGGTISGLVANTNVAIQDGNDAISSTNGFYTFPTSLPSGRVYNIGITNPSGQACAFNPNAAGTGTIGSTNVTNANIVCTGLPYTLGGSVSGLLTNTNVTLSNGNDTILVANGNFTFPTQVVYNSNFSATIINPSGQVCVFSGNSNIGVMPPSNDMNIMVSCSTNQYSLGGSITGLLANTNVTLADGNDVISRTNGAYTFPTLLPSGRSYTVTISNPAGQTCVFNPNTAGNGNMGSAPVTNANVACTTNAYLLGGYVSGLVTGNITLTNTVNADAISVGNGNYLFDQNVVYLGNYNVVATQPNGQICTVTNGNAVQTVGGNSNVWVTCTNTPATYLVVSQYATPRTAGQNGNVNISAYDSLNHVAIGYTGTVRLTITDPNAVFSPNFTFIPAYAGSANVPVTMTTAGTQAITGNDIVTPTLAGRQGSILVNPNVATRLSLANYTTPRTAGQVGNITITAYDAYANIATGYTGTVHMSSTDTNAVKPADYNFTVGNAGMVNLPVQLLTVGTWSISANDTLTSSIAGIQSSIVVNPNGAVRLSVSGYTTPRTAGQSGNITVTAYDVYNNVATGYAGTVQIFSTDANAVKPGNYTFPGATPGTASLPVALLTAGTHAISANDTVTAGITGMQNGIVVQPNVTVRFAVSGFPNPVNARVSGSITILPYDIYNNLVTSYAGTVSVTSSDGVATLPATAAYATPLTVTLRTPGLQTIYATDTGTTSITGQQNNILVNDPNYYTIGGNVSGLSGSVQLQNNGSDTTTINSNGVYAMPTSVQRSSTYALTVSSQPTGQTCSIANASGTVTNANVINANVTCVYINYALGGAVSGLETSTSVGLSNGSDSVTVSANGNFFFPQPVYYNQNYNVVVATNPNIAYCITRFNAGTMPNSNNLTPQIICNPTVTVTTGQAATLVLGQSSFTASSYAGSNAATSSSGAYPYCNAYYSTSGKLYLNDSTDNRLLVYNTVPSAGSGAAASAVVGQSNFSNTGSGTTATTFNYPSGISGDGTKMWVADEMNHRVLGYAAEPSGVVSATVVLGQSNFTNNASACTAGGMFYPSSTATAFGRLFVADANNNRVLIWNTAPTTNGQSPNIVLGQTSLTTCTPATSASGLRMPAGIWSNGKILLVADSGNNRVLLWKSTEDIVTGQAADVVLGQSSMTASGGSASSTTVNSPQGITSDGVSIFVAEKWNNRVSVWTSIPTSNGATINKVLGQSSLSTYGSGTSSTTMNQAQGVTLVKHNLLVSDLQNNRWLGFGF